MVFLTGFGLFLLVCEWPRFGHSRSWLGVVFVLVYGIGYLRCSCGRALRPSQPCPFLAGFLGDPSCLSVAIFLGIHLCATTFELLLCHWPRLGHSNLSVVFVFIAWLV